MKANNYIQIQGWMVTDLNLTGNNLITYALIYGFSQDGQSEFTGSIKYVCKWLGCSRNTAIKSLKELTDLHLIDKTQVEVNNVTFNKYSANLTSAGTFQGGSAETAPPVQNMNRGSAETARGGSAETAPNNTIYNNTTYTKKEFLQDWNELRAKHLKKPSFLNTLNAEETEHLRILSKDYNRESIRSALIGLFKQKKMPNDNQIMQSNPKHFLTHFNGYLTAYHDQNENLYGKKQLENAL